MSRKNKTDWFRAGIELLLNLGADALTVEKLAAQTGVTKGSFYHHFGHLAAYKAALLDYLDQTGFADVVQRIDSSQDAAAQLQQLRKLISTYDHAEDRALRLWAGRDEQALGLVQRLDQRRMDYLTQRFTEATGDPARATFLTRLAYALFLGSAQIQPPIRGEEYLQMVTALEQLFFAALEQSRGERA